jgi:hypothetical protein
MVPKTPRVNNPFESIPHPEEERSQIELSAAVMRQLLAKRYPAPEQALRGVHPKSHSCLKAKFHVLSGIDRSLQVGLFREPGASFDAVVRYSNADSLVRPDLKNGENGSRGMAIKIHGAGGKLLYDDGKSSQDFLMINTPQFAFTNVADYLKLQRILLKFDDNPLPFFAPLQSPPPSDPDELAEFLRVKQSFDVVTLIKQIPVANPLEVAYFGAAPFLFGSNRVMRISVVPQGPKKPQIVPDSPSDNYLREALQETMSGSEDVIFEVNVQVRNAGEEALHIEDATRFWPTEEFPEQTVATIRIPAPQSDLDSENSLGDCERHFFTPWHALPEHQPLGGINRLRRAVYLASFDHRRGSHVE